ncbi:MAG: hypothetical protein M1836_006471 [Candelina mexicana]|nr:MAG: hypothetical protein M1836_006471 [Candelina mexicana]
MGILVSARLGVAAIWVGSSSGGRDLFGQFVDVFNDVSKTTPEQKRAAVNVNAITRTLRKEYVRGVLHQEIGYFDSHHPGSVATSISNNADLVHNGLSERLGIAIQAISMLVSSFIIAFTKNWRLTLVTSTSLPVLAVATAATIKLDSGLESKILAIQTEAGTLAEEVLGSIPTIIAYDAGKKMVSKYASYLERAKTYSKKRGPTLGAQYCLDYFVLLSAYALAFWYGVTLVNRGRIASGGTVATVLLCINQGTTALMTLAPSIEEITKAASAARGLLILAKRKSGIDPSSTAGKTITQFLGDIELRKVTFAYPLRPNMKVLDSVDAHFPRGKSTAIVGASGCGKSTIVSLIQRWYDYQTGDLTFDGVSIRHLNLQWLRSQIGLVQQEPTLFNDTIRQNVAYGLRSTSATPMSTEEQQLQIQAACKQANIHDFIESLPQGYDTVVGERGGLISGGQKQRIAIARCIISDPRIMLLDEATAALDPTSEAIIQATLDTVAKNRTTIIIAHKLSTVRKADNILVMQNGKIVEQGPYSALIEKNGIFAGLAAKQTLSMDGAGENIEKVDAIEDCSQERIVVEKTLAEVPSVNEKVFAPSLSSGSDQEESQPHMWQSLQKMMAGHRGLRVWSVVGILTCLAAGAVYPVQAFLFAKMITVFQLEGAQLQSRANFWASMFFVLAVSTLVSYAALGYSFTIAASTIVRYYQASYFSSMLRQDMAWFQEQENPSTVLTSRLATDVQQLNGLFSVTLGFILIVIVDLISSMALSIAIGWKLALVSLFGCLPPIIMAGAGRMKLESYHRARNLLFYEESVRYASEAVGAIKTVASLSLENEVYQRYKRRLSIPVHRSYKNTLFSMILYALADSIYLLAMGLAFWYGGTLVSKGEYSSQQFFIVFTAIISGGQAAGIFFGYTNNITKARSAANRILALQDRKAIINDSAGAPWPDDNAKDSHMIVFDNVSFSYGSRHSAILRSIDLSIRRGQTVALVGSSGSGKSTMIALLERFFDVTGGAIRIQGHVIQNLDVRSYRSKVALVSQETNLYQGTVYENLTLGAAEDVSEVCVIEACKNANIHDYITSLPEGYHTQCGVRGKTFSGGQRQRIAIARALVRDPAILLLDEATSALDSDSERSVQEALKKAAAGRTTVAVAHRLSTVKDSDVIFVLANGQVTEQGDHEALIRYRGIYFAMCQAQGLNS